MSTIEKALVIAAQAHADCKDKSGLPYIMHPIRVMLGVEGEAAQIVAVLHDVVEDTPVTLDDIRHEGFSDAVVAALDLVTHRKDQSYVDYVVACKDNPIARQVKLSDLRDNSKIDRVLLRSDRLSSDIVRIQRYVLSFRFLTDVLHESEYRQLMAQLD